MTGPALCLPRSARQCGREGPHAGRSRCEVPRRRQTDRWRSARTGHRHRVWNGSAPLALLRPTDAAAQGGGGPAGGAPASWGAGAGPAENRSSAEARPRILLLSRSPSQTPRAETRSGAARRHGDHARRGRLAPTKKVKNKVNPNCGVYRIQSVKTLPSRRTVGAERGDVPGWPSRRARLRGRHV